MRGFMSRWPCPRLHASEAVHACRGTTLAEVLVGTLITSVVVGGTMSAFVTAARIKSIQSGPKIIEGTGYAQDLFEAFHNHVAADDPFFTTKAGKSWQDDDPSTSIPPLPLGDPNEKIKRVYRVEAKNCGGVVGDCYAVTVKVCWNQPTCP